MESEFKICANFLLLTRPCGPLENAPRAKFGQSLRTAALNHVPSAHYADSRSVTRRTHAESSEADGVQHQDSEAAPRHGEQRREHARRR